MTECTCEGHRVPSDGRRDAPLLIVVPAPSIDDIKSGRLLSDKNSFLLWSTLGKMGVARADCRVISVICCWPEGPNDTPSVAQIAECRDRFDREVAESGARIVLCLGGPSMRRLMGLKDRVSYVTGYLYPPKDAADQERKTWGQVGEYKSNCRGGKKGDPKYGWIKTIARSVLPPATEWVIPTFEPSGVSGMGYKPQFAFAVALGRAVRALRGMLNVEVVEFSTTPTFDRAEHSDFVSVDIEGRDTVEAVGLSTAQGTWTSLFTPEAREASKRLLGDPDTIKVAHNISFDMPRLEKFGVEMKGRLFCTMQAANMLQPDLPKGLDKVVPLHLDVLKWKHLAESDPDLYNASDVAHTRKVAMAQAKIMLAQGSWPLFFDTIMPAYRTLIGMTKRGIRIDLQHLHGWQQQLDVQQAELRKQWTDLVGNVNWASTKQLHTLFYHDRRIPFQYNRDGKVTLDEEALEAIKMQNPEHTKLVDTLIGLRGVGKMRSTYADVEFSEDGCVHPDYLPSSRDFVDQSGKKEMVSTLRLSSWIMTIPKESEARRLYVPHQPGMVIIKGDWDQIELRIDAAMANDKQMLKDLETDLHARTAERLGISRDLAKRINYAICKGAGRKKLVLTLKEDGIFVTEPEAQQLINSWNLAYPDLAAFHDYIRDQVSTKRRIINRFGHVRPFYGGSRDGNKALGYSTQSNSACLTWKSFIPLDEAFTSLGGSLLINVHDEFVAEVPASKEKQGRDAMFEIMNREYPEINTGFRVPVSVKAGPNWKDVS